MKFTVSKNELLTKLLVVGKVINSKTTLPVLDNFFCTIEGGKLIITGSDQESLLTTSLEINITKNDDIVKFLMPSKLILDSLKSFSEQPIEFEIMEMGCVCKYSGGHFGFGFANPDEFPQMKKPEFETEFTISEQLLHEGIEAVKNFAGNDDLRPQLSGVFFQSDNGIFSFAATNTNYMAVYDYNVSDPNEPKVSFLVSRKIINIISSILEDSTTIKVSEKYIEITSGSYKLISRQIDGRFPNYKSVIPQDNNLKIRVKTQELKAAIQRTSIFANQHSRLIVFNVSNNLKLSAQDIDFSISAEETVSCIESNVSSLRIGFKMDFILQSISHIKTDECLLEFNSPERATLIKPVNPEDENASLLYLVMPLLINN